jgi:hypothetical protein
VPVVHTVELLDWATGGPAPRTLGPASGLAGGQLPELTGTATRPPGR